MSAYVYFWEQTKSLVGVSFYLEIGMKITDIYLSSRFLTLSSFSRPELTSYNVQSMPEPFTTVNINNILRFLQECDFYDKFFFTRLHFYINQMVYVRRMGR